MQFRCRVGTPDGQVLESIFEGRDEQALRSDLEGRGYHIFEIRRRAWWSSLLAGGLRSRDAVAPRTLLLFNQELAALLRSGLPLLQSLDLLLERQTDEDFRGALQAMRDRVQAGEALSQVVADMGGRFPSLYAPTLTAGERSGELEQVLRRFMRYQKLLLEARRKLVSAVIYPTVLIGLSAALILVMAGYVLPRFEEFFSGFNAELPILTRIVLGFSSFLQNYGIPLAIVLAVGGVVFAQWRKTRAGRLQFDGWKLRIPIVGGILRSMAVSEFCRSLSTLTAGGTPIVPALEFSTAAVGNARVREELAPLAGDVREGAALAAGLDRTGAVSKLTVDMVQVGEVTGSLDTMLADVSDFLDEQVDTRMERLLGLLEPVMLILMGLVISLLLVAVYLPLYSLLGRVGV